jgi:hypothetical protein
MKPPNKNLLHLYDFGIIESIDVVYKQTGTDTAETYVKLKNSFGSIYGKWDTYKEYLDVEVGYNSIAHLKRNHKKVCDDYKTWLNERDSDYQEYLRLKRIFEK